METLPSGTVTFLFTDIEGSTRRWEQHQAAMREALARHDTTLRRAIEAHGGYVFRLEGDAFCAAFATASAALAAACAAQQALQSSNRIHYLLPSPCPRTVPFIWATFR